MIHRFLVLLLVPLCAAGDPALLGFDDATAQLALEDEFRRHLNASDQAAWARQLTAHPHHAGSPHDQANVEYLAGLFRSWGYQVEVESFEVLLPVPIERRLEMLAPTAFRASLTEDVLPDDASSAERDAVLPPYNAFSADGDVTGELVFVNYGIPEDYEMLERYGVDVAGKIVIARYGRSWRGIKPKLAAEHGAIGALIYSDPADDGYAQGDVYPKGPWKNDSGVQRGSVMDMPVYPGDVLTPGKPAVRGVRRLKRSRAATLSRIPVLPISYRDAQPLLASLAGEVVPEAWRGALPITYHLGPGPATVRLAVHFNWQMIGVSDVIARWPGSELADEWVLRGNHHDAWNHGAADPVSGLVALLAEARAVAQLARSGHPPRRTVVYAAWGAEEPGLIGSTEWVEQHIDDLHAHAVAYLNSDGNSRGFLGVGGSHTLEPFFNQVAAAVTDPQTGVSVAERLRAAIIVGPDEARRKDLEASDRLPIAPLGSGSDYTPFLQHAGIASANLAFRGEGRGGSYHTLYDTFEHFTRFRDPGFAYGVALADFAGTSTLRLANAEVLPLRFEALAENLERYLNEIIELADKARAEARKLREDLDAGRYRLALDPTRALGPPQPRPSVPFFNFAPLRNALTGLAAAAKRVDALLDAVPAERRAAVNRLLRASERSLTRGDGLPGRPWYRHQVYAPGFYTGYGVKTLPRVREAIEAEHYADVDAEIAATAAVFDALTAHLERIEQTVSGG